jgi:hypothetical protein
MSHFEVSVDDFTVTSTVVDEFQDETLAAFFKNCSKVTKKVGKGDKRGRKLSTLIATIALKSFKDLPTVHC